MSFDVCIFFSEIYLGGGGIFGRRTDICVNIDKHNNLIEVNNWFK